MELLAAAGDRSAAIRQYRRWSRCSTANWGFAAAATTERYEAIREGELPAAPRPPISIVGPEADVASTLPPLRDASTSAPLVGRDGELEDDHGDVAGGAA